MPLPVVWRESNKNKKEVYWECAQIKKYFRWFLPTTFEIDQRFQKLN